MSARKAVVQLNGFKKCIKAATDVLAEYVKDYLNQTEGKEQLKSLIIMRRNEIQENVKQLIEIALPNLSKEEEKPKVEATEETLRRVRSLYEDEEEEEEVVEIQPKKPKVK